jgi:4-amino-4-deoxy-L-arabinose transferase-like glycosyltransferase
MKRVVLETVKNNPALIIILFFGLFLRTILLNQFPVGITHDELNYVISGKSLFWTGNFAPGTAPAVLPTSMKQFNVTVAEAPSLLLALFVGPFDNSLFASRILGAVLSTSIILAVYLLVKEITGKKLYGLISALVVVINPWSFLMGRTIMETNFFVAFFLWGFFVLLKTRGWKMFYALPLYALGFFSYLGGQITFFLFIVITLVFHYFRSNSKKFIKPYIVFFVIAAFILAGYIAVISRNQSFGARGAEIALPTNPEIAKVVDQEKQLAVQSPLNQLFINKATIYLRGVSDRYLNAFSVNNLFISGESRAVFSYQKHGTFYIVDLFFIVLGLAYLFSINKKAWLAILAIIAVSPLTSGLSLVEYSYSQRAGLMFPFLAILSGLGISYLTTLSKSKNVKNLLLAGVGIVYLLFFINLMHLYFNRFPVYASDGWFFHERTLSRYVQLTSEKYSNSRIIVTTFEPKIVFEEYLFYTNNYQGEKIKDINEKMTRGDYSYGNVSFTEKCLDKNLDRNTIWISETTSNCQISSKEPNVLRITRFRDINENYLIKGDMLCRNFPLAGYVSPTVFGNMELEKQDASLFCQNWITKL